MTFTSTRSIIGLAHLLVIIALAINTLTPSRAYAQVTISEISVSVTGETGESIADARVTIVNTATGLTRTTATDAQGGALVSKLSVSGLYNVSVSADGFQSMVAEGIDLRLGGTTLLTFELSNFLNNDEIVVVGQRSVISGAESEGVFSPNNSFRLPSPLVVPYEAPPSSASLDQKIEFYLAYQLRILGDLAPSVPPLAKEKPSLILAAIRFVAGDDYARRVFGSSSLEYRYSLLTLLERAELKHALEQEEILLMQRTSQPTPDKVQIDQKPYPDGSIETEIDTPTSSTIGTQIDPSILPANKDEFGIDTPVDIQSVRSLEKASSINRTQDLIRLSVIRRDLRALESVGRTMNQRESKTARFLENLKTGWPEIAVLLGLIIGLAGLLYAHLGLKNGSPNTGPANNDVNVNSTAEKTQEVDIPIPVSPDSDGKTDTAEEPVVPRQGTTTA